MPGEDRCKHGMIPAYCSRCQERPEYEMANTRYKGIKEIKHYGNSIHEFDKNFMFGKDKAKLFLACINIVEEFASTEGSEKPHIRDQEVVDKVSGDRIVVKAYNSFQLSDGRRVNIPWVHLQSGRYSDLDVGFGRRKAKAIVALRRQLARWANYPLVDR